MTNAFVDRDAPEPTPAMISATLGASLPAWNELLQVLGEVGAKTAWKWYRDGGWLFRAIKGSKTILWASIDADGFIDGSFYFAERLREPLAEFPGLTTRQVRGIRESEPWGRTIPVPFELRTEADVKAIQVVIDAKLALK